MRQRATQLATPRFTLKRPNRPRVHGGKRAKAHPPARAHTAHPQTSVSTRRLPARQRYGLHTVARAGRACRAAKPAKEPEPSSLRQSPRHAQPNLTWQATTKLGGETNYFLGNDPAKWRTHIPHFARAEAPRVAPGVSLVAYGNDDALEYDLRVAPGADIANLRVNISGGDGKHIDAAAIW